MGNRARPGPAPCHQPSLPGAMSTRPRLSSRARALPVGHYAHERLEHQHLCADTRHKPLTETEASRTQVHVQRGTKKVQSGFSNQAASACRVAPGQPTGNTKGHSIHLVPTGDPWQSPDCSLEDAGLCDRVDQGLCRPAIPTRASSSSPARHPLCLQQH